MKPTSIIFLILAVVLVIGGVVTCNVAQGMADENGIDLFENSAEDDGESEIKNIIDVDTVSKIKLELKNCNVVINGGAEYSTVTLKNFSKNAYEYLVSNKCLTVNDSFSVMSLFNLSSDSFSFNGLRYYLTVDWNNDRQRTVEINLADDDSIKKIEISVENGSVTIADVCSNADYIISVDTGDVNFSTEKRFSSLDVDVNNGNITYYVPTFIGNAVLDCDNGDIKATVKDNGTRSYNLTGKTVIYFSRDKEGQYSFAPVASMYSFTATAPNGTLEVIRFEEVVSD